MMALWQASEAGQATGGRVVGGWSAAGISIDSRTLAAGDLFVALHGDRFDGHEYVPQALEAGAAAAMIDRPVAALPGDTPLLIVADSMHGLGALGAAGRARSGARIAAVTGSVGKTSTKEALATVLGRQALTHASAGNLNNHIGVPLSLARLAPEARYAVFELGMNHPGEIAPLSGQVRPHVAIITNVGPAHLEFFADETAIADEKAAILAGLEPGGTAVLNRDNPHYARLARHAMARGARILSFGENDVADYRLIDVTLAETGSDVEARHAGATLRYRVGAPGKHWALNSLAVLAAVKALGGDVERAAQDFATVTAPKGRGVFQRVALPAGAITLIDESYNASPLAMRAAFALLEIQRPASGGRRIAVLGDMLELGPGAADIHAALAEPLAASAVDLVFAAGPLMRHLFDRLPPAKRGVHAADAASLVAPLTAALKAGDVVTIKGSLGSRMGLVVKALLDSAPPQQKKAETR
jgi:UDP-N-acetylmuramoyl-tripeptide--D-alanyl-D-alanine ligase